MNQQDYQTSHNRPTTLGDKPTLETEDQFQTDDYRR